MTTLYEGTGAFTVWVDASSLALRVTLAVDEFIIEDACWLRPENDSRHINLAKFDTTLKGVNLAGQGPTHCHGLCMRASVDN